MNRRRGEASFVALRVGFWNDPKLVLSLARDLKIPRGLAGAYIAQWEEFVLEVGDSMTGRVHGYKAEHLAAVLDFRGKPARLIEALKKTGVLGVQRGTFFHPFWRETRTGYYAYMRADDSQRKAKERAKDGGLEQGVEPDSPRTVPGQEPDSPRTVSGITDINKERTSPDSPPNPPPGGAAAGRERWERILKIAPRPQNPKECIPLLAALSAEHWELVQFVYELRQNPPPGIGVKKRAWNAGTDRFLRQQLFLNFLPEWVEKLRRENEPKKDPDRIAAEAAEAEAEAEEKKRQREERETRRRRDEMRTYLAQEVSDPDVSDRVKEAARKKWREEFPGETPPWEVA